jgi:hypothetical protein
MSPEPQTSSEAVSAPLDREEIKRLMREASWEQPLRCTHCDGEGNLPGGPRQIHTLLGGFGADWNLDDALAAIDRATDVQWGWSLLGHDLKALVDGKVVAFGVSRPKSGNAA